MSRRMITVLLVLSLAIAAWASGCGSGTTTQTQTQTQTTEPAVEVPAEFRPLYDELSAKLDELDNYLSRQASTATAPTLCSAELLEANGNRGEELLRPGTLEAVTLVIGRLKEMGVQAVTVAVLYPLLVPSFPRSSEYLDFFREVAAETRRQGLELIVKTTTVFPDPAYGSLGVSYAGLTLDRYMQEKRQMVRTVAAELHPDYLTLENEPGTQRRNTGLDFSVANQTAIVNYLLEGLDRTGLRVGAGGGTWDDLAYFRSLAADTSVDYLDIHIYPIQNGLVIPRVEEIASLARASGKRLAVGESWLYKASEEELGRGIAVDEKAFARDAFSFWEPLDQRYLQAMGELCSAMDMEFYSPFWTKYFFGYLDYDGSMRDMGFAQVSRKVNPLIYANLQAGSLTATGEAYRAMVQR